MTRHREARPTLGTNRIDDAVPPRDKTALLVFFLSVALQLPTFDRSFVPIDEGQLTAIGARLLSGEVLYRDIYTGIFPGIYWLTAALLACFGTDVLVLRLAQLVVNSLTATGLFLLARPLVTGGAAWAAPISYLALAVLSFPVFTIFSYSSTAMLAVIGAMLAARRFIETGTPLYALLLGALLAFSVICKQNYGAFALAAAGIAAVWTRREGSLSRRSLLYVFGYPIIGGSIVALVMTAVLVLSGAWPTFFEYTFLTIFKSQMEAFHQPVPPVLGPHPVGDGKFLFFYSPGGLFAAMFHGHSWATPTSLSLAIRVGYGTAWLAILLLPFLAWRFAVGGNESERITAKLLVPFAALMFLGLFPSAIWSHLASVYPLLLVVLPAACSAATKALRPRSSARRGATVAGALGLAVVVAAALLVGTDVHRAYSRKSPLQGVSVHLSSKDAKLYGAADEFLRRCAPDGAPIFVAPDMPLLYVTSGRRNPTPYDLIIPGDVRDEVIVDRIDRAGVDCVVVNPEMYIQFDDFEKLFPKLHSYLATKFEVTGRESAGGSTWRFLERRREAS